MSLGLKRLVLAASLLAMPLQGVAESATALRYHIAGAEQAAHVTNSHNGHDHGARHDNHQSNDSGAGHFCGHHFTSVPPAATLRVVTPDFPVQALAPHPLHDLFFPEQPQRPPLA